MNAIYSAMKQLLKRNKIFEIGLKQPNLTPQTLSLVYTPGVGEVCQLIKNIPSTIHTHTARNYSVAVVSNGNIFNVKPIAMLPYLQWLCIQLRYYAGISSYPIIVQKDANIAEVINDLGGSLGGIIFLEQIDPKSIDDDILVLSHQTITHKIGKGLSEAQITAYLTGVLLATHKYGFQSQAKLEEYLEELSDSYKAWFQLTTKFGFDEVRKGQHLFLQRKKQLDINRLFSKHTTAENALFVHEQNVGKIFMKLNFTNINLLNRYFNHQTLLKLVNQINMDPIKAFQFTSKRYICTIITDGTAVLGLGDIGPRAALPVMEGKSCLFKHLGGIDVVPLCIKPKNTIQQTNKSIKNICGSFKAINLQDIKAPTCFQIEQGLKKSLDMAIFHDDQHGTAIVVLAGLINAAKVTKKPLSQCKIVINGAGAAGLTIAKLLHAYKAKNIIVCDTKGAISKDRKQNMNVFKIKIAQFTNINNIKGDLQLCLKEADIFVGVSIGNCVKKEWIRTMNQKNVIFALANPYPEILPDQAKQGGGFIIGTGRSDFPNQINNSLVFPGIFRGILQSGSNSITMDMKILAAEAIAQSLRQEPTRECIISKSLDIDVAHMIAKKIVNYKKELQLLDK